MDRLQFLIAKFLTQWAPILGEETTTRLFHVIASCDPTGCIENGRVIRAGIYTEWLLKQAKCIADANLKIVGVNPEEIPRYITNDWTLYFEEDGEKVRADLQVYHTKKHKIPAEGINPYGPNYRGIRHDPIIVTRDIHSIKGTNGRSIDILYHTAKHLRQFLTHAEVEEKISKEITVVYESPKTKILIPKTWEASKVYGAGTRWCTASKENERWFSTYAGKGPLYIIIFHETKRKYQFHAETTSYMDAEDQVVEPVTVLTQDEHALKAFIKFLRKQVRYGKQTAAAELLQRIDLFGRENQTRLKNPDTRRRTLQEVPLSVVPEFIRRKMISAEAVNRLLRSKGSLLRFTPQGAPKIVISDLADLADLFEKQDKKEYESFTSCGSANVYVDSSYIDGLEDELTQKNYELIRQILKINGIEDALTATNSEIWAYAKEDDEIHQVFLRAIEEAEASAYEAARVECFDETIKDVLGRNRRHQIGKNYYRVFQSDKIAKLLPRINCEEHTVFTNILDAIRETLDNDGEPVSVEDADRMSYYRSKEYVTNRISEALEEILSAQREFIDSRQLPLALAS